MKGKTLIEEVGRRCAAERGEATAMLSALVRIMQDEAIQGADVQWPCVGTFVPRRHPEYVVPGADGLPARLYPPRISYRFQPAPTVLAADAVAADGERADAALVARIAGTVHVDVARAASFVEALTGAVRSALAADGEVEVPGLGTLRVVDARQGDMRRVAFVVDERMREAVNAPFSCFEPIVLDVEKAPVRAAVAPAEADSPTIGDSDTQPTADSPSFDAPTEGEVADSPSNDAPTEGEVADSPSNDAPTEEEVVGSPSNDAPHGRRVSVWWLAAIAIVALAIVAAFWGTRRQPTADLRPADVGQAAQPEAVAAAADSTTASPEVVAPEAESAPAPAVASSVAPRLMLGADGQPVERRLREGERLTLVALEYYDDKAFWVYIYDVNRDQLPSPDVVPVGTRLRLPDPVAYGIDATNEASVQRAKMRAAEILEAQ